jgi:hypothetical protein
VERVTVVGADRRHIVDPAEGMKVVSERMDSAAVVVQCLRGLALGLEGQLEGRQKSSEQITDAAR